jgi:hypothetical protein
LYDRNQDPGKQINLAAEPAYTNTVDLWSEKLKAAESILPKHIKHFRGAERVPAVLCPAFLPVNSPALG